MRVLVAWCCPFAAVVVNRGLRAIRLNSVLASHKPFGLCRAFTVRQSSTRCTVRRHERTMTHLAVRSDPINSVAGGRLWTAGEGAVLRCLSRRGQRRAHPLLGRVHSLATKTIHALAEASLRQAVVHLQAAPHPPRRAASASAYSLTAPQGRHWVGFELKREPANPANPREPQGTNLLEETLRKSWAEP